ncbi:MAG: hypothetical protein OXR66_09485 [Candidatus Woesearchaeota archaeon]|nr:hypothetical protein [Candidatus Woesearchaeota archaeon]
MSTYNATAEICTYTGADPTVRRRTMKNLVLRDRVSGEAIGMHPFTFFLPTFAAGCDLAHYAGSREHDAVALSTVEPEKDTISKDGATTEKTPLSTRQLKKLFRETESTLTVFADHFRRHVNKP